MLLELDELELLLLGLSVVDIQAAVTKDIMAIDKRLATLNMDIYLLDSYVAFIFCLRAKVSCVRVFS